MLAAAGQRRFHRTSTADLCLCLQVKWEDLYRFHHSMAEDRCQFPQMARCLLRRYRSGQASKDPLRHSQDRNHCLVSRVIFSLFQEHHIDGCESTSMTWCRENVPCDTEWNKMPLSMLESSVPTHSSSTLHRIGSAGMLRH